MIYEGVLLFGVLFVVAYPCSRLPLGRPALQLQRAVLQVSCFSSSDYFIYQ